MQQNAIQYKNITEYSIFLKISLITYFRYIEYGRIGYCNMI